MPDSREPAPIDSQVSARLESAWHDGRGRYAIRDFSLESFVARASEALQERLFDGGVDPTPANMLRLLEVVPVEDFFLLLAFQHGDPGEVTQVLEATLMPLLARSYRQLGATDEEADRYATDKLESLLFGGFRRDAAPGFLNYEARSALPRWIAGVAWHDWRTRRRAESRQPVPMSNAGADHDGEDDWPLTIQDDSRSTPEVGQDDLHDLVLEALESAAASGRVQDIDLESYACSVLSRREHRELADRLGIPPSTFSRRKDRAANVLGVVAKDAMISRLAPRQYAHLRESLDLELRESNRVVLEAVRFFCRTSLRRLRTENRTHDHTHHRKSSEEQH